MEQYIFSVDAQTSKAVKKLNEITRLMDNIERAKSRGDNDYSTTSQKSMDKSMRSISQVTKMYNELNKELKEIQTRMREVSDNQIIPEGASKSQIKEMETFKQKSESQFKAAQQQQRALKSEYENTLKSLKKLSEFQQTSSKNFKHVFSSNDFYNLPRDRGRAENKVRAMAQQSDGVASQLENIKNQIKEVNKLDRRSESVTRRAQASNYMSYQQSSGFQGDYTKAKGDYAIDRQTNLTAMTDMGMERTRLHDEVKHIETSANPSQEQIDRKVALQQTIETMDKEMEARMELNKALDRTISNMESYSERVQGVEIKPERGTFKGMAYERAPAIGLAIGGAVGLAVGGLYSKGSSVKEGIRDDVISIGQRTGQDDWRTDVRDNALNAGIADNMGFTGQQMLDFQNNYLSNRGFKGIDDLNTAMNSQANFSRATGLNSQSTSEFFNSLFDSAVLTGDSVSDIQNAFIGGIKQSGMEGREQDQLDALSTLVKEVSQGRVMGQEQVMNLMGLQSILANSDSKALRGSSGGQFLTDLNQGIRGGADDPMTRLMFGMGSQYQGLEGLWEVTKQMEKGIEDPANIQTIGRISESFGGSETQQNAVAHRFIRGNLGVDATTEQVEGLMKLYRQGELTQENIDKVLDSTSETGSEESQKAIERYKASNEATENQSQAVTEKQSVQLNDFGDVVREANAAMGGLPSPVYATIAALTALSAAALGTAGSFGMARGVRQWAAGKFGGKGKPPKGGSGGGGRLGGWMATGGSMIGGFFGGDSARKGGLPNHGPGGKGVFGRMKDSTKNFFKGGKGGNLGLMAPGGGGVGSGLGKMMGKAFLPLSIASSVATVASAPDGNKGQATGSSVGGLGGMLGGGATGSAIGTAILPGVGTVAGGLIGSIAGSSLGEKIGGWFGGLFDKDKKSAPETQTKSEEIRDIDKQLDRENATRKQQAEQTRSDNIANESSNLTRYETLLNQTDQLLRKARSQNGIFGNQTGTGGTRMGVGGELTDLSGDVTKKDLANTGTMTAEDIDEWINSKAPEDSLMRGMGDAFFKAAQQTGLDPRYLVSHAAQETGWGTSNILKKKNNWFGIGAFDNSPMSSAHSYGGREQGILQGAQWIKDNYYNKGNKTLDQMHNAGYATDPQWDKKIASIMKGAPQGSLRVDSNINVTVTGDERVSDKLRDSSDMNRAAQQINDKVYGALKFYSFESKRG